MVKRVVNRDNLKVLKLVLVLLVILFILVIYQFNNFQKSIKVDLSPVGTTYYVDFINGNDSNSGTSELLPFKTISKINSLTLNPGDSVLFKRGQIWREQLNVPNSGNSTSHIFFGAYGSGPNPIISGANVLTGWQDMGSGIWKVNLTTPTKQVFFNGVRGIPEQDTQLNNEYEWNWSSNTLYIYSLSNPNLIPQNPGIEASVRSLGVSILGKNYITIDGLHADKTNNVGIQAYNATGDVDNITIINSISSYNFGHGVLTTNSHNYLTNDNGFIQNVTSYGNGGSGIQISARTNNTIVRYSTAYGNGFAITEGTGIGSYNASNLLIEYSVSHSNYGNLSGSGAGFYFDVFNEGCVARYNIAYNNSKNGFIAEQGVGVKMYYNIAYNNSHGGFTLYGSDNRSGIHNNSIFNNVAVGNKYGIWVHGDYKLVNDSVTGNIIKNNIAVNNSEYQLFVENGGENDGILGKNNIYENNAFGKSYFGFILWGNASISNYMEFSLAYGNSTNSITTNPLFVDSGNNNFRLLQNSPGIDAGTNVGLIRDFSGNFVPQGRGVDVGAFEYLNISYDNFDGSTTNLSIIDTSNIPNLILEKTGKGKIHFNSPVNLSDGIDLNSRVIINSNHIEINSVISPQLNKSATLTLYNLPFDNPRVLMNDEVCPSNICSNINYNNGNLVFNVIGFSKYSAEETPTNFSGGRGSSGGGSSGSGAGIAGGVQNNNTFFSGSNQSGFNLTDNSTTVSSQENIKRSNTYFLYVLIIIILLFGIGSLSYIIWYISKKKL